MRGFGAAQDAELREPSTLQLKARHEDLHEESSFCRRCKAQHRSRIGRKANANEATNTANLAVLVPTVLRGGGERQITIVRAEEEEEPERFLVVRVQVVIAQIPLQFSLS